MTDPNELTSASDSSQDELTKDTVHPVEGIERGIEEWMKAVVANSPIARHTASYNALRERLPALKSLIAKEIAS